MATVVRLSAEDFRALATSIMRERKCTYREATRIVKKQHPEARAAFVAQHGPGPL